ncbi:hypothetical protein [Corallococcus aberystwythensis]|uniref:hypothetical protein n=1 Tax=Corallococcus aberystwythensis TaxID=2316722 RepID=UPI0011C37069|nr:hypothetical protein [Corallococcus aberystwythensis]
MKSIASGIQFGFSEMLSIESGRYAVDPALTQENWGRLLSRLSVEGLSLSIYDSEYPSPSDPGAYITFFQRNPPEPQWRMTLGNHGWSGGSYVIPLDTLTHYLASAVVDGTIQEFEIESGGRRGYADEGTAANAAMLDRLTNLHRR